MNIIDAVWRPHRAITAAKKKKNLGESIGILVIAAVIFGIAFALIFSPFGSSGLFMGVQAMLVIGLIIFLVIFGLLNGFFIQKLMEAFGVKSNYFAGLSSFAYFLMPLSVGMLLSAILSLIFSGLGGGAGAFLALILSFIIVTPFILIAFATMYNAIRVLFNVDMIGAFVAISAYSLGMIIAIYTIIIPLYFSFISSLMSMGGMLF